MLLRRFPNYSVVTRVSKSDAETLLKESVGQNASFRPHQWEALDSLVNDAGRLLLVQRTGWGKSTVYFIATRLLRDRGAGPTLIVSPLLALMRNQVADAKAQLGLDAATINSNNTDDWDAIQSAALNGEIDLLLVSPERLSNERFQREVLDAIVDEMGLLVIDEAHCISNWGHDFRPDYRRISQLVDRLPATTPIAATTATANDRVVEDVTSQLPGLDPLRGHLVRESLRIQTMAIGSRPKRLAWIAEYLRDTSHSGIIYCLTTDETEAVAEALRDWGHDVHHYHGGMDGEVREEREALLMDNDIEALVATNALGMGFNKPDLGWVIHYQRPPNLIRYYQEIGRAGRALEEAHAFLFSGPDDDEIAEYFIEQAFPSPDEFELVLRTLAESESPLYKYELLQRADISWQAASSSLNLLEVDGAIERIDDGFVVTGQEWSYDFDRVNAVTSHRREELERIQEFVATDDCLTRFVDTELDGDLEEDCGRCANCAGPIRSPDVGSATLVEDARAYYRRNNWQRIKPRYYMHSRDGGRSKIPADEKPEDGRALSIYNDPGWGRVVRADRETAGAFGDELVDAAAEHITDWRPSPTPEWVTAVPSTRSPGLVTGFAERLATRLDLPFVDAISVDAGKSPQRSFSNSYQKCWNVSGAFDIRRDVPDTPVLLVDDLVDSRWTMTEVGITLRRAGGGPVHPFALAERSLW